MVDIDVLIVGGGIQGLSLLHAVKAAGLESAFLVTPDPLGSGETLHSHGFMMRGYVLPPEVPDTSVQAVAAAFDWWTEFCNRNQLRFDESSPTYLGVPDDSRLQRWTKLGLPFTSVAASNSPFAGGHYSKTGKLYQTQERTFTATAIVERMAKDLSGHIGRGHVTELEWSPKTNRIDTCRVAFQDRIVRVRPGFVLLAAGRNNQPLLRGIRSPDGQTPFANALKEKHLLRNVPMLLVRGPDLPKVTGTFVDAKVSMVSHAVDGKDLMWVVTALGDHPTARTDEQSLPSDAVLLREGLTRLKALLPSVAQQLDDRVRYSAYDGLKVDHPEGAMQWFTSSAEISNLRFAWPGVWTLSRTAAMEVVQQLAITDEWKRCAQARKPLAAEARALAVDIPVGTEMRLSDSLKWLSPAEFKQQIQM